MREPLLLFSGVIVASVLLLLFSRKAERASERVTQWAAGLLLLGAIVLLLQNLSEQENNALAAEFSQPWIYDSRGGR